MKGHEIMDMQKILKACWFTPGPKGRWGLPIIFKGKPGTAKTATVEQASQAMGLHLETVIASLREPADFLGLPIPKLEGKKTEEQIHVAYAPPAWALKLASAQRGVAFFDEINTAPPAVMAALLRVVLDGVVGDLVLPKTVRFAAAMNPTGQAAGGWDLPAPLANRFGHWNWETLDFEIWTDWLLGAMDGDEEKTGLKADAEEKRVLEHWTAPFAKAKGLVAGFIRARPQLLMHMPDPGSPQCSEAWPSPRSWEYAVRAIAGAEVHELTEVEADGLLASFIGTGPTSELARYRKDADLPDPAEVLDGKIKFAHDPKRLDRTVAVLASCAALVAPQKAAKRQERAAQLWKILADVVKDMADVAVPCARVLSQAQGKLGYMSEARPALLKLQPILAAAGING